MLKKLRIHNLVLVDLQEIDFAPGYNIISGETGAGKSAILEALRLLSGGKSDSDLLRHGENSGFVEAIFGLTASVAARLQEGGLDPEGDEWIVRRELSREKRSRAYINHRLVSTDFLKEVIQGAFEIVSQKATFLFQEADYQQKLFDEYAGIELKPFQESFSHFCSLQNKFNARESDLAKLQRKLDFILFELEEIESLQPKLGEDDTLFSEYSRLISLSEKEALLRQIEESFSLEPLFNCRKPLATLVKIVPELTALINDFEANISGLQAFSTEIARLSHSCNFDPHTLDRISARLSAIEKMKKKQGGSIASIFERKGNLQQKKSQIEEEIASYDLLEEELLAAKNLSDLEANKLTETRQKAARTLKLKIEGSLRELNMQKAEFEAGLVNATRSSLGDERVQFMAKTNANDKWLIIAESASGGELARLLLAFRLALASKNGAQTLFFDEIDAHIGGETANLVGKKLAELATHHQVIAVTHFRQLAIHAHLHIAVQKSEKQGRTFTQIASIEGHLLTRELERMSGFSSSK